MHETGQYNSTGHHLSIPEATQTTAEYILTILDTQPVSMPAVLPSQIAIIQPATVIAKIQQPSPPPSASAPPTSYIVVDDQQPETSRQLLFTLSLAKPANPPSIGSAQQEDSQHNTSGLSSLFGGIPSVQPYQQIDTPVISPSQFQPSPSPVPYLSHQEESQPPSQSSQHRQLKDQISLH